MNELMEKVNQTPIEIALGIDENGMTTAKKLYAFLELNKSNYSKWCRVNILENEFADENVDYWAFVLNDEWGGQASTDYKLTAHFAKKLSQKGNGAKAVEAREYFTHVEEKAKEFAINRSQLSPQMQMFYVIADGQAKMELEQKKLAKAVEEVKNTQNLIAETFQKVDDTEDFQHWANNMLSRIAESPKFDKGLGRSKNYQFARSESYERLKQTRNCRLDDRVQKAIGRAVEERPDILSTYRNVGAFIV